MRITLMLFGIFLTAIFFSPPLVNGEIYRNDKIGFSYQFDPDWKFINYIPEETDPVTISNLGGNMINAHYSSDKQTYVMVFTHLDKIVDSYEEINTHVFAIHNSENEHIIHTNIPPIQDVKDKLKIENSEINGYAVKKISGYGGSEFYIFENKSGNAIIFRIDRSADKTAIGQMLSSLKIDNPILAEVKFPDSNLVRILPKIDELEPLWRISEVNEEDVTKYEGYSQSLSAKFKNTDVGTIQVFIDELNSAENAVQTYENAKQSSMYTWTKNDSLKGNCHVIILAKTSVVFTCQNGKIVYDVKYNYLGNPVPGPKALYDTGIKITQIIYDNISNDVEFTSGFIPQVPSAEKTEDYPKLPTTMKNNLYSYPIENLLPTMSELGSGWTVLPPGSGIYDEYKVEIIYVKNFDVYLDVFLIRSDIQSAEENYLSSKNLYNKNNGEDFMSGKISCTNYSLFVDGKERLYCYRGNVNLFIIHHSTYDNSLDTALSFVDVISKKLDTPVETENEHVDITKNIPDWIRNNAKWWAEGNIKDSDFISGIQHMIKEKIITIPDLPESGSGDSKVPDWIKNTAKFWSSGDISDQEFVNALKHLIKNGIIKV